MKRNPSAFHLFNVIDTCSIWNLLSSLLLYNTSIQAGCNYLYTEAVHYECFTKPRRSLDDKEKELRERLSRELELGKFKRYTVTIEDLQDLEIIQNRERLGKGELSSIALAKKFNQAFLTDDQGAREYAHKNLDDDKVQTVPHLFGWLIFNNWLSDQDKTQIISEHSSFQRKLANFFNEMFRLALEYRLRNQASTM